jgi:hypothetical protein
VSEPAPVLTIRLSLVRLGVVVLLVTALSYLAEALIPQHWDPFTAISLVVAAAATAWFTVRLEIGPAGIAILSPGAQVATPWSVMGDIGVNGRTLMQSVRVMRSGRNHLDLSPWWAIPPDELARILAECRTIARNAQR